MVAKAPAKKAAPVVVKPASASPETILNQLLQSGNSVNPNQQLDTTPYTPTYSGTPQQTAQDTVDLQYGAQIRAQQQAAQAAAQASALQSQQEQQYGQLIDPRLENIYGALGSSLTKDREATAGNYSSAIDKIRGYYDQASTANQGVNSSLLQSISDSAQKLGLGAAVPASQEGLNRDYQQAQLANNGAEAGQSANLATLASTIYGLDTGRVSSAAQEGAQQRASAQQEVLKTLSDLANSNQTEQAKYADAIAGFQSDKAIDLRSEIAKLTDARSQDSIKARTDALQEMLQRAGLTQQDVSTKAGIAQSLASLNEQKKEFAVNTALKQQEMAQSAAAARAKSSSSGSSSSTSLIKLLASLTNTKSLISSRTKSKTPTGQSALEQFLKAPNSAWKKTTTTKTVKDPFGLVASKGSKKTVATNSAGPKFQAGIQSLLDQAIQRASAPKYDKLGNNIKQNPEQIALQMIAHTKTNLNKTALREAVQSYFEGYQVPADTGDTDMINSLIKSLLGG